MRKIFLVTALASLVGLGGCVSDPLTSVIGDLSSPAATQASVNVGNFVKAFACAVAQGGGAAVQVGQTDVNGAPIAGNSAQAVIQTIYVASTAACALVGGLVGAAALVPAAVVVPVVNSAGVAQ